MQISEAVQHTPVLLGQILDWPAKLYQDRKAIEWSDGSLTFGQLLARIGEQEVLLARCGAMRSQRWGLMMCSPVDFLISLFALWRLGCVVAPLRATEPAARLHSICEQASLNALLLPSNHPVIGPLSRLSSEPYLTKVNERSLALNLNLGHGYSDDKESLRETSIDLDPALILWSSGSTGWPRGVILQHHAVLANMWSNICSLGFHDDDRTLVVLPLTHAYALVHQCLCHLAIGATLCFPSFPLLPPQLPRYIEQLSITTLASVPPVLHILTEGACRTKLACPTLRLVTVGAARTDSSTVESFRSLFPHTQLAITYGLTEAGPRVSTYFVGPGPFEPECVGTPLNNLEVGSRSLGSNNQEIVLRGRSLMLGYVNEPETHTVSQTLYTGDLGSLQDGTLYLQGRLGRTINRGGLLISAEVIEKVLVNHPAVEAVRAEAEAHPFWGEVPIVSVSLNQQEAVTANELDQFCALYLTQEERPVRIMICDHIEPVNHVKGRLLASLFQEED